MENTLLLAVPVSEHLSQEDRTRLGKLLEQAWLTIFRGYAIFFVGLAYATFMIRPGSKWHGYRIGSSHAGPDYMSKSDYNLLYLIFDIVFGSVFLGFLIRDIRRLISPLRKELKNGRKDCCDFLAKKYKDILYGRCLLFYPGKEDLYIEISEDDFNAISNGETLHLQTASITGEVLSMRNGDPIFKEASGFSFDD